MKAVGFKNLDLLVAESGFLYYVLLYSASQDEWLFCFDC